MKSSVADVVRPFKRVVRQQGANSYQTASTTYVDLDTGGTGIWLPCSGKRYAQMRIRGHFANGTASSLLYMRPKIDGQTFPELPYFQVPLINTAFRQAFDFAYDFLPSPGNHLLTWDYQTNTGTVIVYYDTSNALYTTAGEL